MPWSTDCGVEAAGGVGEQVERAGLLVTDQQPEAGHAAHRRGGEHPLGSRATGSRRSGRRRGRPTRRRSRPGRVPRRARARRCRSRARRRRSAATVRNRSLPREHQAGVVAAGHQSGSGVHHGAVDRVEVVAGVDDLGQRRGRPRRSRRRRGREQLVAHRLGGPPPRVRRVLSLSRRRAILARARRDRTVVGDRTRAAASLRRAARSAADAAGSPTSLAAGAAHAFGPGHLRSRAPPGSTSSRRPSRRAGTREVLVEVHALGMSWPDLLLSRGEYQLKPELPFQLGVDFAGVVREAPDGSGFSAGRPGRLRAAVRRRGRPGRAAPRRGLPAAGRGHLREGRRAADELPDRAVRARDPGAARGGRDGAGARGRRRRRHRLPPGREGVRRPHDRGGLHPGEGRLRPRRSAPTRRCSSTASSARSRS